MSDKTAGHQGDRERTVIAITKIQVQQEATTKALEILVKDVKKQPCREHLVAITRLEERMEHVATEAAQTAAKMVFNGGAHRLTMKTGAAGAGGAGILFVMMKAIDILRGWLGGG